MGSPVYGSADHLAAWLVEHGALPSCNQKPA
jgi:hypothetical protein